MLGLIALVIFGLGMAYFATQNTGPTSFTIANFRFTGVPLYLLVIGSLLLGIFISWIANIISGLSSAFTIREKDSEIKHASREIDNLKEEKHELEVENARLKGEDVQESFAHPLKHSFS